MSDHGNTAPVEPKYDLRGWDLWDDEFDLNIRLSGKPFIINISPDNFHDSPSATKDFHKYFDLLTDGDTENDDLWEYLDRAVAPFLPQFESLAPPVVHLGKLTLADLFTRGVFQCRLNVINEMPITSAITPVALGSEEDFDVCALKSPFPVLSPSEVEVPYRNASDALNTIPRQVLIQGLGPLFYKPSISADSSREEIGKYTKIAASGLSLAELRTSRLYGIVANTKGRIHGLLYHWIEADQTLTWAVEAGTPAALRERWAGQIRNTLNKLHQLGVVWGDVKAENILIDKEGNAVIIDLEGGTTQGWVDQDKTGTMEGDLQGLENVMDYIFNDDSVLRPPLGCDDEFNDSFEQE